MTKLSKMLPACGFVIAVALVCVTSSFKGATQKGNVDDLYTFMYNPPSTDPDPLYSKASVENEANWTYAPEETCETGTVKACTIEASQVDASNPSAPELLSSENITAVENGASIAHVTSTFDGTGTTNINNKVN